MHETDRLTPDAIAALFSKLDPSIEHADLTGDYATDLLATQYIWKKGSYRCGITAHIIFFLLSPGFVQRAAKAKPKRFGALITFAKSFDFTDVFIKRVTASGRGQAYGIGLEDTEVQKMLRHIQRAHDVLAIPHLEMVHFGYRLLQQLEDDIGDLPPEVKQHHLRYFSRVYRTMGIPFSSDRELLGTLCEEIEKHRAKYTPVAGEYGRRLLFLGLTVGVPCDSMTLSKLLPNHIKGLFDKHYEDFRPSLPYRILGQTLNILLYARRRFRNPLPNREESAFVSAARLRAAQPHV